MTLARLDLSSALRGEADAEDVHALALALREALSTVGFVTVDGQLYDRALADELADLSARLFALPRADKAALAMAAGGAAWRGWFALGDEFTAGQRDQKEGFYLGVEHGEDHPGVKAGAPMHGRNLWPKQPGFERLPSVVARWMASMRPIAELLMSLVARGLTLEPDYFARRFGDEPTELFRIFRYPSPTPDEDPSPTRPPTRIPASWGVGEHTDMGFLTLLLTDGQPGLEVQELDGTWTPVCVEAGQLVVNVGDMLEVWTRGRYRATPHRVRRPERRARLSWPYFFDPGWSVELDPIDARRLPPTPDLGHRVRRWDGLELAQLAPGTRYGEFVWAKISKVFPELAKTVTDRSGQ